MGGIRTAVLVLVALVLAGCGASTPAAEVPAPSPTGVVTQVLSLANVVLADGRRLHVTMLNGSDPSSSCERDADTALARSLLQGQTVTVTAPKTHDASGIAAPGMVEVDLYTARGENYADLVDAMRFDSRQKACPDPALAAAPTSETPASTAPTSSGRHTDVDVDIDRDHHETRFCRRHWYC